MTLFFYVLVTIRPDDIEMFGLKLNTGIHPGNEIFSLWVLGLGDILKEDTK